MSTTLPFRIEGELTIYRAAELRAALKDALDGLPAGGALEIDLAEVTEMDSAGVQLLMSARRTARETRRTLRLQGHSRAVREVFDTLQLDACFADDAALPEAH